MEQEQLKTAKTVSSFLLKALQQGNPEEAKKQTERLFPSVIEALVPNRLGFEFFDYRWSTLCALKIAIQVQPQSVDWDETISFLRKELPRMIEAVELAQHLLGDKNHLSSDDFHQVRESIAAGH